MTAKARRAWERASAFAACDCHTSGTNVAPVTAMTEWVTEFELWNQWDAGHGIMASLALDGFGVEELP